MDLERARYDVHKVCNKKFASLLGYVSLAEWAGIKDPFEEFVSKKSQEAVVSAYHYATEKMAASSRDVTWKKKEGGTVETSVTFVPMSYHGHLFALHFMYEKK
jgi:hypothetical protein